MSSYQSGYNYIFEIFHQLIDLEVHTFFDISISNTRGHNLKIKRFSVNDKGNEFSNRSANVWNSLPDAIVNCNSLSQFKYKLKSCNIYKYCVRIQKLYLYNVLIISPILFVLHFVLVYCSLIMFSFSIFSSYLHSVLKAL